MTLFTKATNTSAYLKAGFMGNAGSGKTFTSSALAIGLAQLINERKLKEAGRPIFFIDSETGSDYIAPRIREAGFELFSAKTRAFTDLVEGVREAEKNGCVLIIDSITHFWREYCEAYRRRRNRTRLEFQDWATIKEGWAQFTDSYVNSNLHIIMCGRMGYEYEHQTDEETGKKELVKTDVKMKAEGETGYEPSVLVLMERETDVRTNKVTRVAYVLKERFGKIDGLAIRNPTFKDFLPHVEMLNLGGQQLGVDTSRTSDAEFSDAGDTRYSQERREKQIALEEIQEEIVRLYPGQTAGDKRAKGDLLEKHFGTRSWTAIEALSLQRLKEARNSLWKQSRGHGYGEGPPPAASTETPPASEASAA